MKQCKRLKGLLLMLLFFICVTSAYSQKIDSLLNKLKLAKHDTDRVLLLNQLIDAEYDPTRALVYIKQLGAICNKHLIDKKKDELSAFYLKNSANYIGGIGNYKIGIGDLDSALFYFQKAYEIKKKVGDKQGIAELSNNIGYIYNQRGDYDHSIENYLQCLEISQEIENKEFIASSYNNLAASYQNMGQIQKFLEYAFKGLKLREETNDLNGLSYSYNNLATYYLEQNDLPKAIDYFKKCLAITKKLNLKKGIARTLNNLSSCYSKKMEYNKAYELLLESYKICEAEKDKAGMAVAMGNMGWELYKYQHKVEDGIEMIQKSLKLWEEIGVKAQIANKCKNLGAIYYQTNKLPEAEKYAYRSLTISKEIAAPADIEVASGLLKSIYTKLGKYKDALEMSDLSIKMRDSINNIELKKAAFKQNIKYEYEKKALADSVFVAQEKKTNQIKLEKERTQKYALYIGLILVLIFSIFIFSRFKVTQKQKNIIEHQKHIVEEKQKEILDSINYAKRIQSALLASNKLLNDNLPEHFVYYNPKDIVAGDFYWAVNTNEGFIYITADCTGHGVPGAFMSVLSITKLNQSINEKGITQPDLILNSVRDEIITALNPEGSTEESQDGMDAILCKLNRKTMKLEYAAANNSFYIIRNKTIIHCAGDKMPIGKSINDKVSFTCHEVNIEKGDVIYTLTDGYADQFGGPKGKKFRYKQLEELLLKICHLGMPEQKKELGELFNKWRGDLEQIDDVCIIGVKV